MSTLTPEHQKRIDELAARLQYLRDNAPKCPACESEQVQLKEWTSAGATAHWKCRVCKINFFFEPGE